MSKVLLTPGPCMTSESVRMAAALPDLNHRDPEYLDLIRDTKHRLMRVYDGTVDCWQAFLLGGSGTLAVEAMITSCVDRGPVLVLENGYYSSRIRDLLEVHKIPFKAIGHGWRDAWDWLRIESELRSGYEAVVGTHNETTTGRLNDICRLGELSRQNGARCLIDAMSSFGADPIDFTNLDAVCASGNKCLHSIPGVAFVLVQDELARAMVEMPRRSYYMSLPMYAGDNPPLTPPIPALAALRQALHEMPTGGALERRVGYLAKANLIREALTRHGLMPAIPLSESSSTLTTFNLPEGFSYCEWFAANLEAGFVLYGCKGELKDHFFQVANMGNLSVDEIEQWLRVVAQLLEK